MKKLTTLMFLLTIAGLLFGQVILNEDFSSWPLENWTVQNWEHLYEWDWDGNANGYVFTNITGSILATPELVIDTDSYQLVFNYLPECPPQNLNIHVTTDINNLGDPVYELLVEDDSQFNYEQVFVSLEDFNGQTVRIVFVGQTGQGGWDCGLKLDDVIVFSQLSIPVQARLLSPVNNAQDIQLTQSLNWTTQLGGAEPEGYRVYFGTTNPPPFAEDLGNQTTWQPVLDYETTYYWQVVPYADGEDAQDCPVWSFTTRNNPTITSFPWIETFSSWNLPADWSSKQGLIDDESGLIDNNWAWHYYYYFASTDDHINGLCATSNIFGITNKWLITPPVNLDMLEGDKQLVFDIALRDAQFFGSPQLDGFDDRFAVIISEDNGLTWSSASILQVWDNTGDINSLVFNDIDMNGERIVIDLSAYEGIVKFAFYVESTVENADNFFYLDNVTVRNTPTTPIFSINPIEKDFGLIFYNTTEEQVFTVLNQGVGNLVLSDVSLDNNLDFLISGLPQLPIIINENGHISFTVIYSPQSEGSHTAVLSFTESDLRQVHTV